MFQYSETKVALLWHAPALLRSVNIAVDVVEVLGFCSRWKVSDATVK